jgi:hypothetical protein
MATTYLRELLRQCRFDGADSDLLPCAGNIHSDRQAARNRRRAPRW